VAGRSRALLAVLVLLAVLLACPGAAPYDRATWAMEVLPIFVAVPLLWASYRRMPLTALPYVLIFAHACVLMLGGSYTHARVPLGFQIQERLQPGRNPYDKIGHFFQGFVPCMLAREILLRGGHVHGRRMLALVCVCIVLAVTALLLLTRLHDGQLRRMA
jgi:putative membrane protein